MTSLERHAISVNFPATWLFVEQLVQANNNGSLLLSFCEGNPPVTCGFPSQSTRSARGASELVLCKTVNSSWWRHQMETFPALLARCAGNSPVTGEFPSQRPVTRSFDVSFDLRLNKRLGKQSWGWWFETPSWSLWRHRNVICYFLCSCTTNNMGISYVQERHVFTIDSRTDEVKHTHDLNLIIHFASKCVIRLGKLIGILMKLHTKFNSKEYFLRKTQPIKTKT